MTRFALRRMPFGRQPGPDDSGDGLPAPHRARLAARRAAGIAEARAVLEHLPSLGESLHAVCTARMDLTDVIGALFSQLGRCDRMRIATLGYHRRNLGTMLAWLDTGAVGVLSLVASIFFRSHNGDLWDETRAELQRRKQRAACCHSHAKVVTLAFATGQRLSIEGSANLCGNGSGREQFALIHDGGLHDFHAAWIDALVTKHEGNEGDDTAAG
jgi:hypothetical protein